MTSINLTGTDFSVDRAELRKQIITIFLNENPGTGKGKAVSISDFAYNDFDEKNTKKFI